MWRGRNFSKARRKTGQALLGKQRQSELTRGARDGYSFLAEGNPPVSFLQLSLASITHGISVGFCHPICSLIKSSIASAFLEAFSFTSHQYFHFCLSSAEDLTTFPLPLIFPVATLAVLSCVVPVFSSQFLITFLPC